MYGHFESFLLEEFRQHMGFISGLRTSYLKHFPRTPG
jgi:hypothetical protein